MTFPLNPSHSVSACVTPDPSRARANDLGGEGALKRQAETPSKRQNAAVPERCGAKTRTGTPCQARRLPSRKRCKWHGGASTGPRTERGKRVVALNLPRVRSALGLGPTRD